MEDSSFMCDERLLSTIAENNLKMQRIINEDPTHVNKDNKELKKIFLENAKYCSEAFQRRLKIADFSFMMAMATVLDYDLDEQYNFTKHNQLTKKR